MTAQQLGNDFLLMCKNVPVFDITRDIILDYDRIPGSIKAGTASFFEWMKTRYSATSNVTSRRMLMRLFGTDNHNNVLKPTRALSLSDAYWLKEKYENILFEDVTPYLHERWEGGLAFGEGSIATLFTNGAANKRWDDSIYLRKFNSKKEYEVYNIITELYPKPEDNRFELPEYKLDSQDLVLNNFTSMDIFFEALNQSEFLGSTGNHFDVALEVYGQPFAILLLVDYLVEHDDRHSGNIGHLRCANTGKFLKMAPFYDFDWCFSSYSIPLPEKMFCDYNDVVTDFCSRVNILLKSPGFESFEYKAVLEKRFCEILLVKGTN